MNKHHIPSNIRHSELQSERHSSERDDTSFFNQKNRCKHVIVGALIIAVVVYIGYIFFSQSYSNKTVGFISLPDAEHFCKGYHFEVYPNRKTHRKIYDLFMISDELDWLEIRLGTLWDHVDYFVVTESDRTFTNQKKPLFIKENWDLFKRFHSKLIHHQVDYTGTNLTTTWEREHFQRNSMFDQVLPRLQGEQAPEQGDIIIIADVDEIPTPKALKILRNCASAPKMVMRSHWYYYSFQWLRMAENGYHPHATFYNGNNTVRPVDLRTSGAELQIYEGAWHCSYCFKNLEDIVHKIEFFSHQELNTPEFKDRAKILSRVRNGQDLFGRSYEQYGLMPFNENIPDYLKENQGKFKYMVDRDPPDGNFADFRESDAHPQW
jgi:beta-1,4-mannosyl-glycoprotein beta-1,4-N-acetylglucosaminyltransferase